MKFGKITLRQRPSQDNDPVSFEAASINLLVGPNDSGKSLFLKELSGIDPRLKQTRSRTIQSIFSKPYDEPTKILESALWSEELMSEVHELVVAKVSKFNRPEWQYIQCRDWKKLEQLPSVVADCERLRTEISESLSAFFDKETNERATALAKRIAVLESHKIQQHRFVALCTFVALALIREEYTGLLPQSLDKLMRSLPKWWLSLTTVMKKIDVAIPSVNFDKLEREELGRQFVSYLRKVRKVREFLSSLERTLPEVSLQEIEKYKYVGTLIKWLADPQPLRQFHHELMEQRDSYLWSDANYNNQVAETHVYLDGLARLSMTASAELNPFENPSPEPILGLLKDPTRLEFLRKLVFEAFGEYLVIDSTTSAPRTVWRISKEPPEGNVEASYTREAADFASEASTLAERSDGVHAYIGMLVKIIAHAQASVFIDEPEAFLHPPRVRKLAKQLATLARDNDLQFFIATHSPELVESFVTSGIDVNIIRLTYSEGVGRARVLDPSALREFAQDPLLRSEQTLGALFHNAAAVCESASDRVLYQEINERLEVEGSESCVFLNAQNWQTVARMIKPLRTMGIAAAAILDADALFGKEFKRILRASQVPASIEKTLCQQRADFQKNLQTRLGSKTQPKLKGEAIAKLEKGEREAFEMMCDNLAKYGVFLAPVGELEDWLKVLLKEGEAPPSKNRWLLWALNQLGSDPNADNYVEPGEGDVWGFIRGVAKWARNPDRLGTAPASMTFAHVPIVVGERQSRSMD